MKNLRKIFALFILAMALFSCDSDVSIEDPKADTIDNVFAEGDEGNEVERRG